MAAVKIITPERKATKLLVKPDAIFSWFLSSYCKCGCKLRTDNKLVWCSGVNCNYIETKQAFIDRTGFNGQEKVV